MPALRGCLLCHGFNNRDKAHGSAYHLACWVSPASCSPRAGRFAPVRCFILKFQHENKNAFPFNLHRIFCGNIGWCILRNVFYNTLLISKMEATELRIFNYVETQSGSIVPIRGGGINAIEQGNLIVNPIELTETWLKEFGFVVDDLVNTDGDDIVFWSIQKPNGENLYLDENMQPVDTGYKILSYEIQYVHQLQNFYFALTGKELVKWM